MSLFCVLLQSVTATRLRSGSGFGSRLQGLSMESGQSGSLQQAPALHLPSAPHGIDVEPVSGSNSLNAARVSSAAVLRLGLTATSATPKSTRPTCIKKPSLRVEVDIS